MWYRKWRHQYSAPYVKWNISGQKQIRDGPGLEQGIDPTNARNYDVISSSRDGVCTPLTFHAKCPRLKPDISLVIYIRSIASEPLSRWLTLETILLCIMCYEDRLKRNLLVLWLLFSSCQKSKVIKVFNYCTVVIYFHLECCYEFPLLVIDNEMKYFRESEKF